MWSGVDQAFCCHNTLPATAQWPNTNVNTYIEIKLINDYRDVNEIQTSTAQTSKKREIVLSPLYGFEPQTLISTSKHATNCANSSPLIIIATLKNAPMH